MNTIIVGLAVILFMCLVIVCGYLYRQIYILKRNYKKVFTAQGVDNADELIEAFTEKFATIETSLQNVFTRLDQSDIIQGRCIQKVCLRRYSSFHDSRLQNSFSVALLDGHNDGILITTISLRDSNKIYSKNIQKGKASTQLSDKEQQVLQEAISNV